MRGEQKKRFLINEDKWIDTMAVEFAWMDGLDESSVGEDNSLRHRPSGISEISRVARPCGQEFLFRRVREWFTGLEMLKAPGRVPSIRAMKGKLSSIRETASGGCGFCVRNGFSAFCAMTWPRENASDHGFDDGNTVPQGEEAGKLRFLVVCPTSLEPLER